MTNHEIACDYLSRITDLNIGDLSEALSYKWFRMNTLYHIKTKQGIKVLFKPNLEQELFYTNQHGRDLILKARQLGMTTWKMIDDLDECLFTKDFQAACICHNLIDAQDIFRNKIKYAYDCITDSQREVIAQAGYQLPTAVSDKANSYVFSNGSAIKVAVSARGGTLQSLHISEFGKICKKYPEKAKEIVTGAFESVAIGGTITIESTAEGKEGYFHDYAVASELLEKLHKKPNALEFKFHFFSWYNTKEYSIEGDIDHSLDNYFDKIQGELGMSLTDGQKAWYSAKNAVLGIEMRREYPTTPKEAFEQAIAGAYYEKQFANIYKDGRICEGFNNDAKVNTAWDLGVGDSTCIWFYQKVGTEIHLIDYYENSGEGLEHYANVLYQRGYDYGYHYAPHDIDNRDFSGKGKTRKQMAADGFEIDGSTYKLIFNKVAKLSIEDGINYARKLLDVCVFDADKCKRGILCLESYRKAWNDSLGCYRDKPLHDWASDGADAFRYLAVAEIGERKVVQAHIKNVWNNS